MRLLDLPGSPCTRWQANCADNAHLTLYASATSGTHMQAGKQTVHSSLIASQAVGRITWQLGADAGAATKHATSATVKHVAAAANTVGQAVTQQVTSVFKQAPKEVCSPAAVI